MDNNAGCLRTEHPAEFHKEPHWGTRTISAVVYSVTSPPWGVARARTVRDAAAQKLPRKPSAPGYAGHKGMPNSLHVSGSGCPGVLTGGQYMLLSIVDAAWAPLFT